MKNPWVIVSAGFHNRGGQAKAVAGLASYLARRGHPIHLVGHDIDPELASTENVTVHPVRRPLADAVGNLLLARAGRAVARRMTRSDPFTRVVANGGNCIWPDVNWVHYLHAAFEPDIRLAPFWFRLKEKSVGLVYRRREWRAIRQSRIVIANSHRTADDVAQQIEVPSGRVRAIYYGSDSNWALPTAEERRAARSSFSLHPTAPIISFVGGFGFDNRKGFDTLLAAWKEVSRSPEWDAELVLAGGGRASADLQVQLERNGLADRVRIIGFTNRVYDLLAATDLLVSPVRYEAYGLNVREAICRGVPAIVSAIAGVAEEYAPELRPMLLSDPESAVELAAQLRLWRSDIDGWKALFSPVSERMRSRSWDDMAAEIVAAVEGFP